MTKTSPKAVKQVKNKSRRRKKRRTEDFSSDSSSSSSSSDSESEAEQIDDPAPVEIPKKSAESLSPSTRRALKEVEWKATQPVKAKSKSSSGETSQPKETTAERAELEKKYLQSMTSQFSNDLDELRRRPDFNENSLMVLAKTLQSSSNLFDIEELRELVKS